MVRNKEKEKSNWNNKTVILLKILEKELERIGLRIDEIFKEIQWGEELVNQV